ncbi:hypothetical protein FANTH_4411 [Fusarium anthophilum]|uniref:Uncharacterized protein n=1 Tax=Fusarium anthophilum TaxID=48485 RepID=A0A8H4ZPC7_9HYPO|nr:hypothetical protein FANTH_4411 [Fusarium anthophilum]
MNQGDGDIYGLGVRIGLYLQWAASLVLRLLGSWSSIDSIRKANNVVCGALALATAIKIIEGTALSVDYLISYYLTITLFYAESYNLVSKTDDEDNFDGRRPVRGLLPTFPLVFQNALFAAYTLFGAWYWHEGVKIVQPTVCEPRAAIVCLFDMNDAAWTKAATAISIIAGIIFTIIFLIHIKSLGKGVLSPAELVIVRTLRLVSGCMMIPDTRDIPKDILSGLLRPDPLRKADAADAEWTPIWIPIMAAIFKFIHFALSYLIGPIVAITSVERMIRANHLETGAIRDSTGQMIALFTGISSILLALWDFVKVVFKLGPPQGEE